MPLTTMATELKEQIMQNSEPHDTRALVERLFAAYESGDSQ